MAYVLRPGCLSTISLRKSAFRGNHLMFDCSCPIIEQPHARSPRPVGGGRTWLSRLSAGPRGRGKLQYGFDDFAGGGIREGIRNLCKLVSAYQTVEWKPALPVKRNQLGYERLGHRITLNDSLQTLAVEERSGVEYGPRVLGEGHKAKPSTLCQGRQTRGETVFVTARVQNDIDAPRTNALDFPRYIDLSGIEAVRGAEIQGQRKSLGMYVDSDHDLRAVPMADRRAP